MVLTDEEPGRGQLASPGRSSSWKTIDPLARRGVEDTMSGPCTNPLDHAASCAAADRLFHGAGNRHAAGQRCRLEDDFERSAAGFGFCREDSMWRTLREMLAARSPEEVQV